MNQKEYREFSQARALIEINLCRKNAGLSPLSELPASNNTAENNKAEQKRVTPVKRLSIMEIMQRDKKKSIFKRI